MMFLASAFFEQCRNVLSGVEAFLWEPMPLEAASVYRGGPASQTLYQLVLSYLTCHNNSC